MNLCFRKTALVLLLILALTAGCKKESAEETSTGIKGTWELRRVNGEMLEMDLAPGNGNLLKFTDSTYQVHVNGQLVRAGKYKLVIDSAGPPACIAVPEAWFRQRIIYDDDYTGPGSFFQIENARLNIASCRPGWADARTWNIYIKIEGAAD
jgi:hypothetical protein